MPRTGRVGRTVGLTVRGWALLTVGVLAIAGGLTLRYPGLLGLGMALLVALVVSVLGLFTRRGIRVERELPDRPIRRLTEVSAAVRLRVPAGVGLGSVELVDHVDRRPLPPRRIDLSGAAPGIDYPLPTGEPGEVTVGPLELRLSGFAGLARMRWVHRDSGQVLVLARALSVRLPDNGSLPMETTRGEELEGGGLELRSLRPYIPGDDLRKVNARVSARMGKLMIRQDAEPAITTIAVLVDNSPECSALVRAEMLDVATSIVGSAVRDALPVSVSARGESGRSVDADGLGATERSLAVLPLTDEPWQPAASADLVIAVAGPTARPGEIAQRAHQIGARGVLVLVAVDPEGENAHTEDSAVIAGVLRIQARTAEMALRRVSALERSGARR